MKIISTSISLIEWPSNLSYVIFLAGCNLQCPFCYVPHLVKEETYSNLQTIPQQQVLEEIQERADANFIDAVCITGGEPTIHPELQELLQKIKQTNPNLKISLTTNGTNPQFLKQLIDNKLINSIAFDIKNSKKKYQQTTNTEINLENINKTLELIKTLDDYEVHTTLVPDLHTLEDVKQMASWLKHKGINKLTIQQFRSDLPNQQTLNPEFMKKPNYPTNKLKEIAENIKDVEIEVRD